MNAVATALNLINNQLNQKNRNENEYQSSSNFSSANVEAWVNARLACKACFDEVESTQASSEPYHRACLNLLSFTKPFECQPNDPFQVYIHTRSTLMFSIYMYKYISFSHIPLSLLLSFSPLFLFACLKGRPTVEDWLWQCLWFATILPEDWALQTSTLNMSKLTQIVMSNNQKFEMQNNPFRYSFSLFIYISLHVFG